MKKKSKKISLKKSLLEWGAIFSVLAILYMTGLHVPVLGTLQRAMLWTGLFDAEGTEISTQNGPFLKSNDYNFSLIDNDGDRLKLSDYEGKVLFINVWASWCPPCVAEMPTIETLYQSVSDQEDIEFIMLSMDQQPNDAVEFMEKRNFTMPYHFPASTIPVIINSPYLPTTYVINKEGQVVYMKEGIADYSNPSYKNWLIELGM